MHSRKFRAWLYRIAANTCADFWRRSQSTEPLTEGEYLDPGFERAELSCDLRSALAALPPAQREVVLLRYYEEFTLEEIADTLGIAPGAVSARLTRAKRKLRPMLEEWYYD